MFYDPKHHINVSINEVVKEAENYDIIIFGEKHDSKDCHDVELALLKALSERYKIIFSLEMFERDVQAVLDRYVSGNISEDEFLENVRPWSNYQSDYRPLIEFSRKKKIPVVASNVPRYIASKVAKNGVSVIDSITSKERKFVAQTVFYNEPEYRLRFYRTMESIHMPGFTKEMKENYYKAQCLKDATMAESIIKAIKDRHGYKVFHINGSFHSDYYKGVVWQITKMAPGLKVLVISPLPKGEQSKENIGDFIFYYDE